MKCELYKCDEIRWDVSNMDANAQMTESDIRMGWRMGQKKKFRRAHGSDSSTMRDERESDGGRTRKPAPLGKL